MARDLRSSRNDRDALAATLLYREYGLGGADAVYYRDRHLLGQSGRDYWGEALETADAILGAGFSRASAVSQRALTESLETAEGWAEHGYTEHGKSYWSGMRDTLRVVLGITTEVPTNSADDAAAFTMVGAQQRSTRKAPR